MSPAPTTALATRRPAPTQASDTPDDGGPAVADPDNEIAVLVLARARLLPRPAQPPQHIRKPAPERTAVTGTNQSTGRVLELRRPPVRQATVVRSSATHTFEVFIGQIGAWWPVQPFSAGQHQVRAVTIEGQPHGRVYETWQDGSTIDWGRVTTWQPPERVAMTWTMTPAVTHVELTFTALGPHLTRVAVEHRGWDSLTDQQLAEDCALPGGYTSGSYTTGWARVLTALAAAAEASTSPPATDPPPDPRGRTTP